ncbi:MAG: DNA nickase [Oscillatoriales cyanobacterium RM2_1_1]|nr:DNA nickase [Oscillatoriales cyanobacterium SM2_3_0]NJO45207.1 DNA nickase [Oscillatoriales cyanobacterium RM2_1_1]
MVATLTDTKRSAIAQKLADMKAVQSLIVTIDQQLLKESKTQKVSERLQDMFEDDQKNLGIVETTITQYGIQSEPSDKVNKMVDQIQQMMQGSELNFYEKLAQFELLKHGQVMSGLVVHKAAQVVGADVETAIVPLNTVNFENRAHQEQLKGLLEYVGTQELTGEEPDQSFWRRLQDGVAAMSGIVGGAVTQISDADDVDIMSIIYADHQKAKTLIREIQKSDDPARTQEFFGQLYQDLVVHSKAEEEVVYPAVRSFYGDANTQELYSEQTELETVLNAAKQLDSGSDEFIAKINTIKTMVGDHTRQEESTMFAAMRKDLSNDQREQMATQFKAAKQKLQQEMAA